MVASKDRRPTRSPGRRPACSDPPDNVDRPRRAIYWQMTTKIPVANMPVNVAAGLTATPGAIPAHGRGQDGDAGGTLMSRPTKPIDLDKLEMLAVFHCTDEEIASFFGINVRTLRQAQAEPGPRRGPEKRQKRRKRHAAHESTSRPIIRPRWMRFTSF
jgi:hypothetical protein